MKKTLDKKSVFSAYFSHIFAKNAQFAYEK